MKEKTKFGLCGHDYAAPRAECVEIVYNMLLCASKGDIENYSEEEAESIGINWDGSNP